MNINNIITHDDIDTLVNNYNNLMDTMYVALIRFQGSRDNFQAFLRNNPGILFQHFVLDGLYVIHVILAGGTILQ